MSTGCQANRQAASDDRDDVCGVAKIEITAQKKSLHACERETEPVQIRRAEYQAEVATELISRFKFLDEAGSNLAMTRLYGRAAKGERVIETVPQNYGENITMSASLSLSGIEAPMTINGAVDGIVFKVYVEQLLCPTLSAGDIVVMDNAPGSQGFGNQRIDSSQGSEVNLCESIVEI